MPYNEALADRVRDALATRSDVDEKRMFGGVSFMVGGRMCCGVLKDDLIVRIEPDQLDAAVERPHVRPFDFTGRPSAGMVYVSLDGVTSEEDLLYWIEGAVDYVIAHPATARRRR